MQPHAAPHQRFARILQRNRVVLYATLLPAILSLAAFSLEGPRRIALVFLGFSLIIFVHELGHFVVARLCKVKCEVFSIGIGPRMLGWKKGVGFSFGNEPDAPPSPAPRRDEVARNTPVELPPGGDLQSTATDLPSGGPLGECDYRLSWLPLGGYVRMLGQDDMDPTKTSADPRAFNNRPIYQRMAIISAGVIMNILFALVVFAVIFSPWLGVKFPPARIGPVMPGSPAERAGLQIGDEVVAINGEPSRHGFMEFTDIVIASALSNGSEPVRFTIKRGGETFEKSIVPETSPRTGLLAIGVEPLPSLTTVVLPEDQLPDEAKVLQPGLAQVKKGWTVTAVDGQPVADYGDLYRLIQNAAGKDVTLTFNTPEGPTQDVAFHTFLDARSPTSNNPAIAGLVPRTLIKGVVKGDPADAAGVKAGDVVLQAGPTSYPTVSEFMSVLEKNPGKTVNLTLLRDGKEVSLTVTPKLVDGKGRIGVPISQDYAAPVVAAPAKPGEPAGLVRGSRVVSINDTPVSSWHDIRRIVADAPGKSLQFAFQSPAGDTFSAPIAITEKEAAAAAKDFSYSIMLPLEELRQVQKADSVGGAVAMGIHHTKNFVVQTYLTLKGLFTGTIPVSGLHGPLGIGKIGYDAQEKGFIYLWFILAVVSVNLAVANFLPLPIVDGGLFILLIIEKLRGKPLPLKVLNAINLVGLCLLGGLFLFVTINNDLMMFFR